MLLIVPYILNLALPTMSHHIIANPKVRNRGP